MTASWWLAAAVVEASSSSRWELALSKLSKSFESLDRRPDHVRL